MNIGVNARLLIHSRLEGIGRFAFESLKELVKMYPNDQFYFFFDRAFHPSFVFAPNITPVVLHPQARHPILWNIWFEYSLPKAIKKHNIDVLFSPEGYGSLKTNIPQITTHHDANFLRYPDLVKGWKGKYIKEKFPKYAQNSDRVLTVSEFSKQEIAQYYPLEENNIRVCYNGVSSVFTSQQLPKEEEYKKRFSKTLGGFLFVGALSKRKNIANMLLAYTEFRKTTKEEIPFTIVGEELFSCPETEAIFKNHSFKKDIHFLGRLSDEEIVFLMQNARALLFVSFYEGFGLPVVEAQQSGCLVITSSTSCLPEIAGKDSALYAHPEKPSEICQQMILSGDPEIRERYIQKGFENAKKYQWKKVASIIKEEIDHVSQLS
jgi:glycosyltransferase involved in cell wall biosynthesis